MQAVVDAQATPTSRPPLEGLGVGWMDQVLPFQRSTNVRVPVWLV